MNNNKLFAVLGLFLMSIIWGANIPYMKIALNFSGPAEFAFLRNFFGSIILFSILIYLKKPIFIKEAPKLFILGLFQTAGFTGFLTWALLEGIASKTVILVFTMPLWVSMMAWPLLKEKVTVGQWISSGLCLVGIVIIINPLNTSVSIFSCLLALASGFAWACGAIISKKIHIMYPRLDLLTMTAWQMLWGSIPLFMVLLIVNSEPIIWNIFFINITLFNIIFVNAIAYLLWFFALKHLEATLVSMLSLLTPITGAISAWIVLSEVPNEFERVGYILILFSIFSLIYFRKKFNK